jgi:hypothetical protein
MVVFCHGRSHIIYVATEIRHLEIHINHEYQLLKFYNNMIKLSYPGPSLTTCNNLYYHNTMEV